MATVGVKVLIYQYSGKASNYLWREGHQMLTHPGDIWFSINSAITTHW